MKKLICFLFTLSIYLLASCEKGYKDEIFMEKYQGIYGAWEYKYTIVETGIYTGPTYNIEFIPYGQFRYNGEKTGKVKIIEQSENRLYLDFDSLFPKVQYADIDIDKDTLIIVPNGGYVSFYIRIH